MRKAACVVSVLMALMGCGGAQAASVTHGRAINATNTGPAAAGFTTLRPAEGGEIKNGRTYAFAREIAASAAYDGFKVDGPHLLIESTAFSKPLDISMSKPVVFRGVSVRVPAGSAWTILVRPGAGPFYFLWSDAGGDGQGRGGKAPGSALALRGDGATVYRSHLSNAADGIDVGGAHATILETLIDGLATFEGSHNDGVQLAETAEHVTIARNKILNANPQTSCLYLLGKGIRVDANYLAGGGWTIYGGAKNNGHGGQGAAPVAITGNTFGRDYFPKSGHFGPVAYWAKGGFSQNVWTDNRYEDGKSVMP
jgi:hypothetical protein